jgi:hypothetical protein
MLSSKYHDDKTVLVFGAVKVVILATKLHSLRRLTKLFGGLWGDQARPGIDSGLRMLPSSHLLVYNVEVYRLELGV